MKSVIPRVFLDSNIWFSAIYGSSNCQKILKAHTNKKIIAVISQQVLEESILNIQKKIPHMFPVFRDLISAYPPIMTADPAFIYVEIKDLVELKDQPIFTAAIKSKADYFVTGNIKDFKIMELETKTKIRILTPKEAVEILQL